MSTGEFPRSVTSALPSLPPDVELPDSAEPRAENGISPIPGRWMSYGTGIAIALEAVAFLVFGLIAFRDNLVGLILCSVVFGFIVLGALGDALCVGLTARKRRSA